jgi:hypothetical protein
LRTRLARPGDVIDSALAQIIMYMTSTPAMSIPAHSWEQHRNRVNWVAARFQKSLRELWKYANTLAPISRLPEELLVHIFSYLPPDVRVDLAAKESLTQEHFVMEIQKNWIAYAGVCTLWRKVALSNPSLWNTLILRPGTVQLFKEMRILCGDKKSINLTVNDPKKGRYINEQFDDFVAATADNLFSSRSRLRSLQVQGALKMVKSYFSQLRGTWSDMQTLVLSAQYGGVPNEVPEVLASDLEVPKLRRLGLMDTPSTWVHALVPRSTLTLLILSGLIPKLKVSNLLDILSQTHCLEYLHFREIGESWSMSDESACMQFQGGSIEMLGLTHFVLEESQFCMYHILRCLALPSRCSIKITASLDRQAASDIGNRVSDLTQRLIDQIVQTAQKLIDGQPLTSFYVNGKSGHPCMELHSHRGWSMMATITHCGHVSAMMATFAAVLEPMGTFNFRYIGTPYGPPNPWRTLVNTLAHMSFVEILENETKVTSLMLHDRDMGASFGITHRDWTPQRYRYLRKDEPDYGTLYDIDLCEEPQTAREVLGAILAAFTRVKSKILILDSYVTLPAGVETRVFEVFQETEKLHLYGQSAVKILKSMTEKRRMKSGIVSFPFPDLKVLVLHNVDLRRKSTPAFAQVVHTLKTRPLLQCELDDCYGLTDAGHRVLSDSTPSLSTNGGAKKKDGKYLLYNPNS